MRVQNIQVKFVDPGCSLGDRPRVVVQIQKEVVHAAHGGQHVGRATKDAGAYPAVGGRRIREPHRLPAKRLHPAGARGDGSRPQFLCRLNTPSGSERTRAGAHRAAAHGLQPRNSAPRRDVGQEVVRLHRARREGVFVVRSGQTAPHVLGQQFLTAERPFQVLHGKPHPPRDHADRRAIHCLPEPEAAPEPLDRLCQLRWAFHGCVIRNSIADSQASAVYSPCLAFSKTSGSLAPTPSFYVEDYTIASLKSQYDLSRMTACISAGAWPILAASGSETKRDATCNRFYFLLFT
jgi:hypothetical protein